MAKKKVKRSPAISMGKRGPAISKGGRSPAVGEPMEELTNEEVDKIYKIIDNYGKDGETPYKAPKGLKIKNIDVNKYKPKSGKVSGTYKDLDRPKVNKSPGLMKVSDKLDPIKKKTKKKVKKKITLKKKKVVREEDKAPTKENAYKYFKKKEAESKKKKKKDYRLRKKYRKDMEGLMNKY